MSGAAGTRLTEEAPLCPSHSAATAFCRFQEMGSFSFFWGGGSLLFGFSPRMFWGNADEFNSRCQKFGAKRRKKKNLSLFKANKKGVDLDSIYYDLFFVSTNSTAGLANCCSGKTAPNRGPPCLHECV